MTFGKKKIQRCYYGHVNSFLRPLALLNLPTLLSCFLPLHKPASFVAHEYSLTPETLHELFFLFLFHQISTVLLQHFFLLPTNCQLSRHTNCQLPLYKIASFLSQSPHPELVFLIVLVSFWHLTHLFAYLFSPFIWMLTPLIQRIFLFKVFLTARTRLHRYVPGQYWELKYILQKEELMNIYSFLSHFFSAFLSSLLSLSEVPFNTKYYW